MQRLFQPIKFNCKFIMLPLYPNRMFSGLLPHYKAPLLCPANATTLISDTPKSVLKASYFSKHNLNNITCLEKIEQLNELSTKKINNTEVLYLLEQLDNTDVQYLYIFDMPSVILMKRNGNKNILNWQFIFPCYEFRIIKINQNEYIFTHANKGIFGNNLEKISFEKTKTLNEICIVVKKLQYIFNSKSIDKKFIQYWHEVTIENINDIDNAYISPFVEHNFNPIVTIKQLPINL
jgi:hypothetical protein